MTKISLEMSMKIRSLWIAGHNFQVMPENQVFMSPVTLLEDIVVFVTRLLQLKKTTVSKVTEYV